MTRLAALLAVFMQHGDNKASQQRFVCLPGAMRDDVRGAPFMLTCDRVQEQPAQIVDTQSRFDALVRGAPDDANPACIAGIEPHIPVSTCRRADGHGTPDV